MYIEGHSDSEHEGDTTLLINHYIADSKNKYNLEHNIDVGNEVEDKILPKLTKKVSQNVEKNVEKKEDYKLNSVIKVEPEIKINEQDIKILDDDDDDDEEEEEDDDD
jgi:hypothetical protein